MKVLIGIIATSLVALSQAHASFVVTSDPLWTDSGMTVSSGQVLTFTASGTWNWGGGDIGPDGSASGSSWDEWIINNKHGQLIGFVGTPLGGGDSPWDNRNQGDVPPGPTNPGQFFEIGSSATVTMPITGTLWFGFNDDRVSGAIGDNTGSVAVNVVPEPSTYLAGLSALGMLGLFGWRNRK